MRVGPFEFYDYLAVCVATAALLAVIPFVIPFRGRTLMRFLLGGIAIAVTMSIAVMPLGATSFEGIHVAYGILTWSFPAMGVAAVVSTFISRMQVQRGVSLPLGILCIIPAFVGYYATNIEPKRLAVDHYDVGTPTSESKRLRVVVISDIQSPEVGDFERRAARTAARQEADLILSPGDLYSGEDDPFPQQFEAFRELIKSMDAPFGTYFVPGDHDGDDMLPALVEAGGKTFLQEHLHEVRVRDLRVGILGLDTDYSSKNANQLMADLAARDDLDYKIVLEHRPDVIFNTPAGIDLVVAGHTHGGQVRIPFIGPVVTLSDIPREQAAGGLFDYPGNRKLFVTRGIGVEHGNAPVVRFNAKPQVAVLNINVP
jgi:predicted MPP superfamily phosphohydrolase